MANPQTPLRTSLRRRSIALQLTLGTLLGFTACQEVPITGRSALNLVRHEDVVRVGTQAFEQLKRKHGLSRDRESNERVRRVGDRIARVAFWDVPHADWEFVVLHAPNEINASASPGGKVAVMSGFFKIIENDDQLAWIIAHEISHVAARHSDERISRLMLAKTGSLAAAIGMTAAGTPNAGAAVGAYDLATGLSHLAFSRQQELEADHMGLVYMARAGFNPEHAVRIFERMADARTSTGMPIPVPMLSTHPAYPERTLHLIDKTPVAMKEFQQTASQPAIKVIR